jgi:hypothetical protein
MTPEERVEHERSLARQRNVRYRAAHRDELRASEKVRRGAHQAQRRAYNDAYRATHREEARAYRATLNPAALRAYNRDYNLANRARLTHQKKAYHAAHRDEDRTRAKAYYAANQESIKAYWARNKAKTAKRGAAYKQANRGRYTAHQRKRDAVRLKAMPAWADPKAIAAVYREAARLTRETGVQHDVDHICPLQGKTVCGLHVDYNLQILTHVENMRKHNKVLPLAIVARVA